MTTLSATYLIKRYNEVSKRCKETGEPIYQTRNRKNDLVVLSIVAYEKTFIKRKAT